MNSRAQIANSIAARLVAALCIAVAMPVAVAALIAVRTIEAIGDSRAWGAFARFWWGERNSCGGRR